MKDAEPAPDGSPSRGNVGQVTRRAVVLQFPPWVFTSFP
jgi:hypothetical protein